MAHVPTTPVTLGASRLGERPDGDALADALLASPLGNVDTSNNYADGRSEALLGDAIRRAAGLPPEAFAAHVSRVRDLAREAGVDLAAAALQFSTRHPLIDTTVVGIPSLARLDALADLVAADVPDAFFDEIEALGAPPASGND